MMRLSAACAVLLAAVAPVATSSFVVQPAARTGRTGGRSTPFGTPSAIATSTSSLQMAQPGYYLDAEMPGYGSAVEGEDKKKAQAKARADKLEKKKFEPKERKKAEPKERKQPAKEPKKPKEKKPKEPKKPKPKPAATAASSGKEALNPFTKLIAPLAPLAALGAGRAYLTRRDSIRKETEEIARAEEELLAKKAELESKEAANGVSMHTSICSLHEFCRR